MLKRLRKLFDCEEYKELAAILGVTASRVYLWKRKGPPDNIKGLLTLIEQQQEEILKQQQEIIKLKEGE